MAGLALGISGAWAFSQWTDWKLATLGLALCMAWMIADGLDGMVARATDTSSAFGRFLDGVCDHTVYLLLYVGLANSIGTVEGWTLATLAGIAHAFQSTLYEGERTRFHRRVKGDPGRKRPAQLKNILVRSYDMVAGSLDRLAEPFDREMEAAGDPKRLGEIYGHEAAPLLKTMVLLSSNARVITLYLACLAGDPKLFFWYELVPLSGIALAGMFWHRRIEARLVRETIPSRRIAR
jgi:hypothetical protein